MTTDTGVDLGILLRYRWKLISQEHQRQILKAGELRDGIDRGQSSGIRG